MIHPNFKKSSKIVQNRHFRHISCHFNTISFMAHKSGWYYKMSQNDHFQAILVPFQHGFYLLINQGDIIKCLKMTLFMRFLGHFRTWYRKRQNMRILQNRHKMPILGRFMAVSNNNNHMIKVELICWFLVSVDSESLMRTNHCGWRRNWCFLQYHTMSRAYQPGWYTYRTAVCRHMKMRPYVTGN